MLSRIVAAKLREGRRLIIPDLGVFIVKGDGSLLFSELMRGDDGVLRSAVAAERGVSDAEALRIIERFVTDIRRALDCGMSYRLEGMGMLSRDSRGVVVFTSREQIMMRRESEHPARTGLDRLLAESAEPESEETMPASAEKEPESVAEHESAPVRPRKRREGVDMFILVAVVIAVVAVAAIVYGIWTAARRDDGTTVKELFVPQSGQESPAAEPVESSVESDGVRDLSVPSSGNYR